MSQLRPRFPEFRVAIFATALLAAAAAWAGPVQDGTYSGKLDCSALIGNPSNAGWSSPVELHVDGDSVSWLRGNRQFQESAQSLWRGNSLDVDASGAYTTGATRQGRWRTIGSLRLDGGQLAGAMRQVSPAGDQVFRNCSASFAVALQPLPTRRDAPDARAQATEDCAWKGGAACRTLAAAEAAAVDPARLSAGSTQMADTLPIPSRNVPIAPQNGSVANAPGSPVGVPPAGEAVRANASGQPADASPAIASGMNSAVQSTAVAANAAIPATGEDAGTAKRYVAFSEFGDHWVLWVIVGAVLTLYLPLSFLLSGPAGAIEQLSVLNLLDIFNRTGKIRPYAAEAQSFLMVGLFGIAMILIGPLIVWFNAGVPMAHRTDDASTTICCVERPEFTSDKRLAIDLYRDDPFLPWYMIKTILTSKANGPWKLRILDTTKGQFVDLRGFGKTEDQGSTLVLGHNESYLKTRFLADRLRVLVENSSSLAVDLRADAIGFQYWPAGDHLQPDSKPTDDQIERARRAKTGFTVGDITPAGAHTRLLVAREKPDNDGLLGALKGLWSLVATWEHFAWIDGDTGQVRRKATLFGNARHAGSTPDGGTQIFLAAGGYVKLVRTPELQAR